MARSARIPRLAWAFAILVGVLLFAGGLFVRSLSDSSGPADGVSVAGDDGSAVDSRYEGGGDTGSRNREVQGDGSQMEGARAEAATEASYGESGDAETVAEPTPVDEGFAGRVASVSDREPAAARVRGTVALIIDDVGRRVQTIDRFHRLGAPISYAVLPFESRTPEVAARVVAFGGELMVHLPMEGGHAADPGPGALMSHMSPDEVRRLTRRALAALPEAVGVNNHMGSVVSADPALMAAVLDEVFASGLFFVDSRTSPHSVAFAAARERGVPAAERDVFLDTERSAAAIDLQFDVLLERAARDGAAIAIGHPYEETLDVLERRVPEAIRAGYRFVPASYLLESSDR